MGVKSKSEKKKKELQEDLEYLRLVDLPESQGGGRKFVEDYEKDKEKKKKKKTDDLKTSLQFKSDRKFSYRKQLSDYGFSGLLLIDFPKGWEYYCVPTDTKRINIFGKNFKTQEGVLMILRSPKQDVYIRGIRTTYDPLYDVSAIDTLLLQAENTIDSSKGILLSDNMDTVSTFKKRKSGVYGPN